MSTRLKKLSLCHPAFSGLLKELIETALYNFDQTPTRYRYSQKIKYFSMYIYMFSGRFCYETISNNLPFPKADTVCKLFWYVESFKLLCSHLILLKIVVHYIHNDKDRIIEGELRCTQLVSHLKKLQAPPKVWLSEDASGIVQKAVFDSFSNQLVGLVLPVNNESGMPIPFTTDGIT